MKWSDLWDRDGGKESEMGVEATDRWTRIYSATVLKRPFISEYIWDIQLGQAASVLL